MMSSPPTPRAWEGCLPCQLCIPPVLPPRATEFPSGKVAGTGFADVLGAAPFRQCSDHPKTRAQLEAKLISLKEKFRNFLGLEGHDWSNSSNTRLLTMTGNRKLHRLARHCMSLRVVRTESTITLLTLTSPSHSTSSIILDNHPTSPLASVTQAWAQPKGSKALRELKPLTSPRTNFVSSKGATAASNLLLTWFMVQSST